VGQTIGERALALCRRCAVRSQCLDHALHHEITSGYFGGESPSVRRAQPLPQPSASGDLEQHRTHLVSEGLAGKRL
jgi:hypothetical protein